MEKTHDIEHCPDCLRGPCVTKPIEILRRAFSKERKREFTLEETMKEIEVVIERLKKEIREYEA